MNNNSRRIFPSHRNRTPLQAIKFGTIQERDTFIIGKRRDGHTLQEIADAVGLTREMIRLIVAKHNGPSAKQVREIRSTKKRHEIERAFESLEIADAELIAKAIGATKEEVRKALGRRAKRLARYTSNREKFYSDDELSEILWIAYSKVTGPLTTNKYKKLGILPTIAVYISRFGSWAQACQRAGVPHGQPARKSYTRAHTREDMLDYIASYLADPRTTGSAHGYDKWQRNVEGAPSLTLIRQRLGTWNEIKDLLAKRKS
jgi:hypothetical protein